MTEQGSLYLYTRKVILTGESVDVFTDVSFYCLFFSVYKGMQFIDFNNHLISDTIDMFLNTKNARQHTVAPLASCYQK